MSSNENTRVIKHSAAYYIYPFAKKIAPYFHSLGITPNMVTIFNIFFIILKY